jgi:exosortase
MSVQLESSKPAIAGLPEVIHPDLVNRAAPVAPVGGSRTGFWLATFGLLALVFAPRFLELGRRWMDDANYSHGFFVPLVSAILAWRWVRTAGVPRAGQGALGLAWILGGCLLHLLAQAVWFPPVDFLALTLSLYGLAVLAGGRSWARGLRFPIAFLFFMFPLPAALTEPVALWLQDVVSGLGTALLQFFMPAYREGNLIYLPRQRLEVGEACSGLRQVVAFLALALLIGQVRARSWSQKLTLVIAAVPVAIAANLLRLLCMAFLAEHAGPAWIGGAFHDVWGLLTLLAGVGMLAGVSWWVEKLVGPGDEVPSAKRQTTAVVGTQAAKPRVFWPFVAADTCLGLTLVVQLMLWSHVREASPPADVRLEQSLASFPNDLGDWRGQDMPVEALGYFGQADDKLNRLYVLEQGPAAGLRCQLWIVHFRDGRDRAHHPIICHEVAGYAQVEHGRASIPVEGEAFPIERFCFSRNGTATYVFYWHYTLEPPAPAAQSLLQRIYQPRPARWPSVTLEVFTTARDAEELDAAGAFVRSVENRVRLHLPVYARMGSDLLPVRLIRE